MHTRCETGLPCQGHQPETGGGLVLHVATESKLRPCENRSMATSRGKSRGSPHQCATKTRPLCWLGKRQSRGRGTYCHCLHLALLGPSIVADSTYCTPQSCLGSSAHHCSLARAAGPGAALAPRVTAWSRLLQPSVSPGQSAATRGAAPPCLRGWSWEGQHPRGQWVMLICALAGRPGDPAKPLHGVRSTGLLAPASSWLIS